MTVQKDVQRAGLRVLMAQSMLTVPEYSDDPEVLSRVGHVIGGTTGEEERHVRASDSLLRSTSKTTGPLQVPSGPSNWLFSFSMGALFFMAVGLLGVLVYRLFA